MNNKYDLGNFAKLLEEFSTLTEMRQIDEYLYGVSQETVSQDDTESAKDSDRSSVNR